MKKIFPFWKIICNYNKKEEIRWAISICEIILARRFTNGIHFQQHLNGAMGCTLLMELWDTVIEPGRWALWYSIINNIQNNTYMLEVVQWTARICVYQHKDHLYFDTIAQNRSFLINYNFVFIFIPIPWWTKELWARLHLTFSIYF